MSNSNEPHPLERSIYLEAVDIQSTDARQAFLDRACDGDPHLRERGWGSVLGWGTVLNGAVLRSLIDKKGGEKPGDMTIK